MKEKISVIVPIYNVEKYVIKCIESIINQTYKELEIILVDDGSPDSSGGICDEYAKQDDRIRVIHKKNGGLSDARNAGIEVASGEYIAFVDGDDYIAPQMYEKLYTAIKRYNADISICNFTYVDEEGNELEEFSGYFPIKNECIDAKQIFSKKLFEKKQHYWVVAWNKLYKKEVFENLRYPIGKIHEDEYVVHEIYDKKKIACISDSLLYYVQRQGSITAEKNMIGLLHVAEAYLNRAEFYIKNEYDYEDITKLVFAAGIYIKPLKEFRKETCSRKEIKELIKAYRKILMAMYKRTADIKNKLHIIRRIVDPYGMIVSILKKG